MKNTGKSEHSKDSTVQYVSDSVTCHFSAVQGVIDNVQCYFSEVLVNDNVQC